MSDATGETNEYILLRLMADSIKLVCARRDLGLAINTQTTYTTCEKSRWRQFEWSRSRLHYIYGRGLAAEHVVRVWESESASRMPILQCAK